MAVLHTASYSDDAINERIKIALQHNTRLSASDLAQIEGVGIGIAGVMLENCERTGVVVRDDAISGLHFYPNLILTSF